MYIVIQAMPYDKLRRLLKYPLGEGVLFYHGCLMDFMDFWQLYIYLRTFLLIKMEQPSESFQRHEIFIKNWSKHYQ